MCFISIRLVFFWSFTPGSCPKWISLILVILHTRVKSKSWNSSQVLGYSLTRNFRVLHAWHKHLQSIEIRVFHEAWISPTSLLQHGDGEKTIFVLACCSWFCCLVPQVTQILQDFPLCIRQLELWAGACCISCVYACMLHVWQGCWYLWSLTDRLIKADLVVHRELNMIYWTAAMWH